MEKSISTTRLRAHQAISKQHLLAVLRQLGAALDGSDTGTGKTYTATAVAAELDLPTLAVVPKISRTSWRNVAEYLGTTFSIEGWEKVRAGTSPYGRWQFPMPKPRPVYFVCIRCFARMKDPAKAQPCPNQFAGIHCVETKHLKHNYGVFTWHRGIKFLIMDEIHRANGMGTQQSEMLIAAKRQGIPVLGLSATPAVSPLKFMALGYLLGLHELEGPDGFYAWSRKYGCRKHPVHRGWHWLAKKEDRPRIMARLRESLFPAAGVRVRCQDIPGFPKRLVETVLFDLGGPAKIDRLYKEMGEAMEGLRQAKRLDRNPDHPLTKLLRLRQEIELLKVPAVVERCQDALDAGLSVAIFCNYKQTIAELSKRLKCTDIIDGERIDREEVIDRFQSDEARVVLVNSQAGGISVNLHDLRGEYPRLGIVMPTSDVVIMWQVWGRLQRDGGQSLAHYIIPLAAGTKEESIHKKFMAKSQDLSALLDEDFLPDDLV